MTKLVIQYKFCYVSKTHPFTHCIPYPGPQDKHKTIPDSRLPPFKPTLPKFSWLLLPLLAVTHIKSCQELSNQLGGQVASAGQELSSLNANQPLQITADGSWCCCSRATGLQSISTSLNTVPEPLTPGTSKASVGIHGTGEAARG